MTTITFRITKNPDYAPGNGSKFFATVGYPRGNEWVAARSGGSTKGIAAGRAMRRLVEKEEI